MSRPGDLFDDMPALPPTFEQRDDDILAALVSGAPLPSDAPVETRLVADLFASLSGPASAAETEGLDAARRAFRTEIRPGAHEVASHRVGRRGASRPPSRSRGSGRLVAASVLGALGLSGFAGAAFAGVLPDAIQTAAHGLVGAVPPASAEHGVSSTAKHASGSPTSAGVGTTHGTGPDATGSAAFGLCTAYDRTRHVDSAHRAAYAHSLAYQRLVAAAGGADQVEAYCAAVPAPSADAPGTTNSAGKPSGTPGGASSHGRPSNPGRPSTAPSHPAHSPNPSSAAPSHKPPSSKPVAAGHTKTPTKGPAPDGRPPGSTRSAH